MGKNPKYDGKKRKNFRSKGPKRDNSRKTPKISAEEKANLEAKLPIAQTPDARYKPETGGILPMEEHSRANGLITSVLDDDYFGSRGAYFDPDANPADLQTMLSQSLESYMTPEQLKMIEATERADGEDYLTAIWSVLQAWYVLNVWKMLLPAIFGAVDAGTCTATAILTTEQYLAIEAELKRTPIPQGLLELIQRQNPIIQVAAAQPVKEYRGAFRTRWIPHLAYADYWTKLGNLKTYLEAFNYFAKIKMPVEVYTGLPTPIIVNYNTLTPYNLYLYSSFWIIGYDVDGTGYKIFTPGDWWEDADSTIPLANILTDLMTSTTWYTSVYKYTTSGSRFSDMWILIRMEGIYDATHNNVGCAYVAHDTLESRVGIADLDATTLAIRCSFKATSFSTVSWANLVYLFGRCSMLFVDNTSKHTLVKTYLAGLTWSLDFESTENVDYIAASSSYQTNVEMTMFKSLLNKKGLIYYGD